MIVPGWVVALPLAVVAAGGLGLIFRFVKEDRARAWWIYALLGLTVVYYAAVSQLEIQVDGPVEVYGNEAVT